MTTTATTTSTSTDTTTQETEKLHMTVEFTGGLEILFDNVPKHSVSVPRTSRDGGQRTRIKELIPWLCDNLMVDSRREMFVLDGGIRPGILVLINDADWELEGEEMYEIQEGDCVLFVSTLHGG